MMDERNIKRLLDPVMRRVRLACSRGRVNTVTDAHKAQNLQVSLLSGETVEHVERLQNYGFSSVPVGGNDVVVLSVGGKREHLVAVAVEDRSVRPQGKESGDVIVYHAEGHYARLTADGKIIVACKNIEFHVDEKTLINTTDFELNASNSTVINSPKTTINAETTVINSPQTEINAETTVINSPQTEINAEKTAINSLQTEVNADTTAINSGVTTVTGDSTTITGETVNINGKTAVTGPQITLTAPTTAINSNLTVSDPDGAPGGSSELRGNLRVVGNTETTGTQTVTGHTILAGGALISGIEFIVHKHPNGNDGNDTGTPI
ncbi:phage baseplate assembly protein V [Salmonella enterica subsp. enterica serovar Kotte]|nr:phage baseplate assembly protein V [Salmonella enterica subsp. enterica serovar Kotte]